MKSFEIPPELNLNAEQKEKLRSFLTRSESSDTPWYVHLVVILGSWFATMLLLLFLFIAKILETTESLKVIGALISVGSIAIPLLDQKKKISESFIVSVGFLGQVLLFLGIAFSKSEILSFSASVLIVEIFLYLFSGTWIQKFVSVLLIFSSSVILLEENEMSLGIHIMLALSGLAIVLLFRYEVEIVSSGKIIPSFYMPTIYGLTIAISGIPALSVIGGSYISTDWRISGTIGILVLAIYLWTCLNSILKDKLFIQGFMVGTICLLLAPTLQTPGISFSVFLIAIGFRQRLDLVLMLGILSISCYLVDYYYSLKFTLLIKSYILLGSGALFLCAYLSLSKLYDRKERENER
ncbi:DUF4401 domain-containing protein [Leptospira fletcheri]|uniref:DUF4401 domain-containing protein n=1 Tax=Leptospira fletcheri TaxID=2484981 RepID=A0A4R9GGQ6_9LEPT|nr:DUF4401 domain-containing protein [Leptospira fletcheri]TGK11858.1 DUF4401 domain-containing protein [Leptospira fletcheri]